MDPQSQVSQTKPSLNDISLGKIASAAKLNTGVGEVGTGVIVSANKLRNSILRSFVDAFMLSKLDNESIIKILLALDEKTEKGEVDENFFEALKKDEDFVNKLLSHK